mgnify:CR=1 FL=1
MQSRNREVVEADTLEGVEGNICEGNRRGTAPEACFVDSTGIEDRGMCGEGCQGTLGDPVLSVGRRNC